MPIVTGNDYPNKSQKRSSSGRPVNGFNTHLVPALKAPSMANPSSSMLAQFLTAFNELGCYRRVSSHTSQTLCQLNFSRTGKSVKIDGHTLSIAAITAAARYNSSVELDASPAAVARVSKSRKVIVDKVSTGASVYGLSTGFGGSGKLLFRPSAAVDK